MRFDRDEVGGVLSLFLGNNDCKNFLLTLFDKVGHSLDSNKSAENINVQSWDWFNSIAVCFRQACVTRAIGHWYSSLINEEKTNGQYHPGAR